MGSNASHAVQALFEARELHLWRGEHHLLRGVSLVLRQGELVQVVGRNGVGKTSLLRAMCGLLPVEVGEILWQGKPIERVRDEFNGALAYLGHANALKADLTPLENLKLDIHLATGDSAQKFETVLDKLGVAACARLPVRVLSQGQRRRVALARVFVSPAPLWILDEPITNLDVQGVATVERFLDEHLNKGGAVIAAAHQRLLQEDARVRSLELN
jgi:heme exporter protein A